MIEPIETGAELYREIKKRGLQLRHDNGRDSELIHKLYERLECSIKSLQTYLDESDITAEQFLNTFLEITQPFAQMFTEIWNFLSINVAPKALETISIRFGFPNSTDKCVLDWEQFRRYTKKSKVITKIVGVKVWPVKAYEKLFTISDILLPRKETPNWLSFSEYTGYRPGSPFLIPTPIIGSNPFDVILQEIASSFQNIIKDYVIEYNKKQERSLPELLDDTNEGDSLQDFAYLLTDLLPRWYFILNYSNYIDETLKNKALIFYENEILPLIRESEIKSQLKIHEALDILDLPFWRHRWHTYEVWATIMTIQSLEDYRAKLRIDNRYVPIDGYSEEIVADIIAKGYPNACIALQFQTPYVSEKRKAIKPDLRICFSENISPETTALVVEYKQRQKMDRHYVEEIAQSYSKGSPKSGGTIIINYDITNIEVNLPSNCILIEGITPVDQANIKKYKDIMSSMLQSVEFLPKNEDVIVLLDVSGSMGDAYKPSRVQQILRNILQTRWIKVLRFNDGLLPGGDLEISATDSIYTSGGTLLGKTILDIEEKFGLPSRLLIVTDGGHDRPTELMKKIPNIKECLPDELEYNFHWLFSNH